jgi:hypothetical protein
MNNRVATLLLIALTLAAAALFVHHPYVMADQVAARLTLAINKNPKFADYATVHHIGPQISVWVLETLPSAARADLERVITEEGKPLKVKLVPLTLVDAPAKATKY